MARKCSRCLELLSDCVCLDDDEEHDLGPSGAGDSGDEPDAA